MDPALGDAYLAQPDDIAAAVQQLRARADGAGNLKPSNEQRIRRVAAPVIAGEPPVPDYYIIEPVDPAVVYVPIYDPYLVYGVWPYPAYRPFYWYPPGYVTVGVFAFGAPLVVGAALWATYDWRARRVAIDVNRFNTFNRTTIVNQTWQHNPVHRGNLPYSNPTVQQQFSKTATGVQGLSKTGIGSQGLPKTGIGSQGLPKTGIGSQGLPKTGMAVRGSRRLGSQGLPKTGIGSQGLPKGGMVTNPQSLPKGTTTKTGPDSVNVNRNVNLGNTKHTGSPKALNNPNVGGNLNVNRNATIPRETSAPRASPRERPRGPSLKVSPSLVDQLNFLGRSAGRSEPGEGGRRARVDVWASRDCRHEPAAARRWTVPLPALRVAMISCTQAATGSASTTLCAGDAEH